MSLEDALIARVKEIIFLMGPDDFVDNLTAGGKDWSVYRYHPIGDYTVMIALRVTDDGACEVGAFGRSLEGLAKVLVDSRHATPMAVPDSAD